MKKINGFLIGALFGLIVSFFSYETVFADITENEIRSVVRIDIVDVYSNEVIEGGSGTIINEDGDILTNFHVIEKVVSYPDDYLLSICLTLDSKNLPECGLPAQVDSYLEAIDLALIFLSLDETTQEYLMLKAYLINENYTLPVIQINYENPKIGEELNILGYPGVGFETITYTKGVVSGFLYPKEGEGVRFIKTDAQINPGNSGGAAFDSNNKFIGVPTFGFASETFGFMDYIIPTNVVDTFINWAYAEVGSDEDKQYEMELNKFIQQEKEAFGDFGIYEWEIGWLYLIGAVVVLVIAIVIWRRAE